MAQIDPQTMPEEWEPGLRALLALPHGGTALLVGATDRGKTTFAALAAQALASAPEPLAVVDADVGQSEIGPPGTVGVGWARPDASRLHEIKPAAVFFVGAFAPAPAALELVVATGQAVAWARERDAGRILVDTTGFVAGPAARRIKTAKTQALRPALIVGVQRDGEIDGLLAVLSAATGAPALSLPVPSGVGRKSTTLRQTRRLARLSMALTNAREVALPLTAIVTVGATLGSGVPIAGHLAGWAGGALRMPVTYAEIADGVLTVFTPALTLRPGWEDAAGPVAQHFRVRSVRAVSLAAYNGILLGLHDDAGRLLCLGRFERLDPDRGDVVISAPLPTASAVERVRLVAFGRVRVAADGATLSEVKPGEV
jgi:polynucleotide 5'-hydroxyl-kinase GRC3/NOL9